MGTYTTTCFFPRCFVWSVWKFCFWVVYMIFIFVFICSFCVHIFIESFECLLLLVYSFNYFLFIFFCFCFVVWFLCIYMFTLVCFFVIFSLHCFHCCSNSFQVIFTFGFGLSLFSFEAYKSKWVNSAYIYDGVNSLKLGGLYSINKSYEKSLGKTFLYNF